MHILFVVPYTPTLIRVRPYNLVRYLARHGHRLMLATLWETDDERRALDEMQKLTDGHIAKLDQAAKAKEKEILDIK